jgi:hypothetical protein
VFVELPPIPETLLEGGFRRAVLDFMVAERAISDASFPVKWIKPISTLAR